MLKEFTGVSDPYEAPATPELVLDAGRGSVDEEADQVLKVLRNAGFIACCLMAAIKMAGGSHRYWMQDLWLASHATQHGLRFLTRNERDFTDIPGLDLVVMPSATV